MGQRGRVRRSVRGARPCACCVLGGCRVGVERRPWRKHSRLWCNTAGHADEPYERQRWTTAWSRCGEQDIAGCCRRCCRALADPATQAWCTRNAGRTLAVVVQADNEAAVPGSHPAASAHSLRRAQPAKARRPGREVHMHQRPCHTSSTKQLGPRGRAGCRSLDHDYEREAPCAGRQARERQQRWPIIQLGAYSSNITEPLPERRRVRTEDEAGRAQHIRVRRAVGKGGTEDVCGEPHRNTNAPSAGAC